MSDEGQISWKDDEDIWCACFISSLEDDMDISEDMWEQLKEYFLFNLENGKENDNFTTFIKEVIERLINQPDKALNEKDVRIFLPKIIVFFVDEFIKNIDNENAVSIIEPIFTPTMQTYQKLPDIAGEVAYILLENYKESQNETIGEQLRKFAYALEDPNEFLEIFKSQNSVESTVYEAIYRMIEPDGTEYVKPTEGETVDEYIKYSLGYPIMIKTITGDDFIEEENIGSVIVDNGATIESSINELAEEGRIEAGDSIVITFNYNKKIQTEFSFNNEEYTLERFVFDNGMNYEVCQKKDLSKQEINKENIIAGLYKA